MVVVLCRHSSGGAPPLRAARHTTGRLIFRHPHCAYRQSSVPPHKHYINR